MKQHRLLQRQHPIFSPLALLSTLLLAGGLAGWVFVAGGQAFSPGELSALNRGEVQVGGYFSHADFTNTCSECHTPFKGIEAERCERCHSEVAQQRETGAGLHSRFENAAQCADCHTEHKGQNFDQLAAALVGFDHNLTHFSLMKHPLDYQNSPLACTACHTSTGKFRLVASACADCHQPADANFMAVHTEAFGNDCLACHDGHDSMADFTLEAHAEKFVLSGRHAVAACEQCHTGGQFQTTPTDCLACHDEPAAHAGLFGPECGVCHSPEGWQPAKIDERSFDHAQDTGFSLATHNTNYDGAAFTCRTCHPANQPIGFTHSQCVACHQPADPAFMQNHVALFGESCMNCHDGSGALTNFDHNQVWPLAGQHAALACTACHLNQVFRGTPRDCVGCHAEPAIHAGLFGVACESCHTSQAWQPAQLLQHTFPLDHGGQGESDCATCHPTTYAQYTCYTCHEHDPAETERHHLEANIDRQALPNCIQCHPTGQEAEE